MKTGATIRLHDGPQTRAFKSRATEILYGGAAGGGKSFLIRMALIGWALAIPGLQCYLFRRTFPELDKNHMQGPDSLPVILAPWVDQGDVRINYGKMQVLFRNGSAIHLSHCQHEKDRLNYHGAEIHVLAIDELTTFTYPIYSYLRSRVRMVGIDIPPTCPWVFPRILCGSNPGGIGHTWVKGDWITSANPNDIWEAPQDEGGMMRQYIPARLDDNPTLMKSDPGYYGRLSGLGSPELVKALREGSWDILEGAMFTDVWDESVNWIDPFPIPRSWEISRAFDWGSSKPFSVGWWAKADGTQPITETGERILDYTVPRGTRIRIGEFYGWNGKANQGVRMLPAEIAREILRREKEMGIAGRVKPGAADSSIFDRDRGESIHDKMAGLGVRFVPANKKPGSRVGGWEVMRQMMKAAHQRPMEDPALLVFNTCTNFRRTIPELPRDELRSDDIDTHAEDHIADEARYELTLPRRSSTILPMRGT
jgi:hypothetical protein